MIQFLIKQSRAVHILFIAVFVLGYFALQQLGREELPEFGGTGLSVSAILPGGSPEEIDLKVARPLHQSLKDIPGIEDVSSTTREGLLHLSVEIKADESDPDGLRREIAQIISQVPDMPEDLEGPFVSRQHARLFPAMTLVFSGDNDVARHSAWLAVRDQIQNISEVDTLEILGDRDRRFEVLLDPQRVQQAGLRIDGVARELGGMLTDVGAGQINTPLAHTRIRTRIAPTTTADLSRLPVTTQNGSMPVGSLGKVVDTLEEAEVRVVHRGQQVWYINIYRRSGTNIGTLSERVTVAINRINQQFETQGQSNSLTVLYDRSEVVTDSLDDLSGAVLLGMLLVLIILWAFLGFRNAIYAAIGIPFSFFAVFIVMEMLGLSINTLTLFGLVLVCGMIVDDAIVIIENTHQQYLEGYRGAEAVSRGVATVAPAVVAATGTTIAAFLPLLLMTGGMGLYISQIPQVAILALIASLVECLFILPLHLYQRRSDQKAPLEGRLNFLMVAAAARFTALAAWMLRRAGMAFIGFLGLMCATGILAYMKMDFELFPATEIRVVRFHLEFERQLDLDSTTRLLAHAVSELAEFDDDIKETVSIAGRMNHNYQTRLRPHLGSLELILADSELQYREVEVLGQKMAARLQQLPALVRLQMSLETNTPPKDVPVTIYLYGNDADGLRSSARRVRRLLESIPSIEYVSDPMADGVAEQVFEVDPESASYYGLSSKEIGGLLHGAISGYEVGKINLDDEVVDLYVKSEDAYLSTITRTNGETLPLETLGEFRTSVAPDSVYRYNGERFIRITAEVNEDILSVYRTHREIDEVLGDNLLAPGVTFEQQGEYSQTQESLSSMIRSGIVAIALSYLILASLFRSYLQPVMVLLVVPLSYMGVIWGMTLMGETLTLMGFIGVVGLIGIVVNDALVWVSFYNQRRMSGDDARSAATAAVKRRFRPIWLTTLTTLFGLLPASLSDSAGIAQAMAHTMVYGLLGASCLLLLFLPVCVVVLDDFTAWLEKMSQTLRTSRLAYFEELPDNPV